LWARPASYATLVLIILEQQVSLASARSAFDRLAGRAGEVTPEQVLELGQDRIRAVGLTRQKARYVVELASALTDGRLSLRRVAQMNDEDARAALMTVRGIGHWTANIYLLMALRRPDVWPIYDLALRQSFKSLRGLGKAPTDDQLARKALKWRPYRSVAARLLWHRYLRERR
jgi:DNA-3-methyladenine glycosylase II